MSTRTQIRRKAGARILRVGAYARISKNKTGAMLQIERQFFEIDEYVDTSLPTWQIVERYSDDDISAYSGKRRPGYERMLADLEAGVIDAIVCWHPDRLLRTLKELERVIDLVNATGAEFASVKSADYDLTTAAGRLSARIIGTVALHESEHKSERLCSKSDEHARAGRVGGGGNRPYGYEADRLTMRLDEAEIIREVAARVLRGEAMNAVTRDLQKRDVRAPGGKHWTTTNLKIMLKSPRIAGLRQHRLAQTLKEGGTIADAIMLDDTTGEPVVAAWPAIITPDQHRLLVHKLTPADGAKRLAPVKSYLLTRFMRCHKCGGPLNSSPSYVKGQPPRRRYVCQKRPGVDACGGTTIMATAPGEQQRDPLAIVAEPGGVEDFVIAAVLGLSDHSWVPKPKRGNAAAAAAAESVPALEAELMLNAQDRKAGLITRAEFFEIRAGIEQRLDAARLLAADVSATSVLGEFARPGSLREAWPTMTLDRRRCVLAALIERIVIGPADPSIRRFDKRRVLIDWRS
jgi:site-specific DNA recombinase